MSDLSHSPMAAHEVHSLFAPDKRTNARNAAEKRFRAYGLVAISLALLALLWLMISIFSAGLPAFRQTFIEIPVTLDAAVLDKAGHGIPSEMASVSTIGYGKVLAKALSAEVAKRGIDIGTMKDKDIAEMISEESAAGLRNMVLADPKLLGTTISFEALANGRIDGYFKGRVTMESAARDKNTSPEKLALADKLRAAGVISMKLNSGFLTRPDASDKRPEAAGLGVAIIGSLYMMFVVLVLALPIGVAASVYLEEFAPKNRWTDLIEVNIANLAAVPSIVYGILGLSIFINFAGLPQSAPVVGGLVLTLMTLPRIIIPTRAALKAVPPSIRDAALGIGASKLQTVTHHVLPLAMPGILTGTIIGLAQALGETAPPLADRHGGLCPRLPRPAARGAVRSGLGAAGADLQLDPTRRPRVCRAGLGGDHRPSGLPDPDEHGRHHSATQIRTPLVR